MTDLVGHSMFPMSLERPEWDNDVVLSPPLPLEDATEVVGSDRGMLVAVDDDATSVLDVSVEADSQSLPVSKP